MIIDICVLINGEIVFCTKAKNHKGTFSEKEKMEEELKNGAVLMCDFCGEILEAAN